MLDAKDNYLFIKKEEQEQEQEERKTRDCLFILRLINNFKKRRSWSFGYFIQIAVRLHCKF